MNIDGLWTVVFKSAADSFGGGVVILDTTKVMGGDISYYYLGNYNYENGVIEMSIGVFRYNQINT